MKKFTILKSFAIAAGVMLAMNGWGQTNPDAQLLPYSQNFDALAHNSTVYPAGLQGWTISTTPGATFNTNAPTANRTLTASSTAATNSGNVHNYNGKIGFLNSSSLDLSIVVAINTTGKQDIEVNYDIMTIRNPYDGSSNTRINEVTLQYRIGITGTFTNLTGIEYQNNTTTQTTAVTTPQNLQSKTITLPAACNDEEVVQLRWASRQVSGGGSRPSFAVDNISIDGDDIGGTTPLITVTPASLTGFTYVFGSGPSAEQTFTVEGSDLTADITITPPTNYEISETSLSGYTSNPITLFQSGGVVAETTIYVRLKAGLAVGNYDNELITLASTGADNKTVTCSGSVTAPPPQNSVTFYVDMTNAGSFTNVDIAGNFNGWGNPLTNMTLVQNNIYTYTTAAIFDAGNVISFKFRKDGSWDTAEPGSNRDYTVVAGTNVFHAVYGVMVPAEISWANLQWPSTGNIDPGQEYNAYARVYANGLTGTQGDAPNLNAWIGYSTNNTNPASWTNWIPAAYLADAGNNEEYIANIGSSLAPGTYYYASRFRLGLANYVYGGYSAGGGGLWDGSSYVSGVLTVNAPPPPNVWINEIHYDNDGVDINEFVEVVLENPSNYNLSDFAVLLVNGNGGVVYDTKTLDLFAEGFSYGDFTIYTFTYPANGIQNGAPDGMAISYLGNLIPGQFLSYEGTILGTENPVNGIASVDIGVSQTGGDPIGHSLQLTGVGTQYADFIWNAPDSETPGFINNQQSFFENTTWNGSVDISLDEPANWNNGVPVFGMDVIIPDVTNDPVLSGSSNIGNLTINTDAALSIAAIGQLTVIGVLVNSGNLLIQSNATSTGSLIHNTTGIQATAERYIPLAGNWGTGADGWHFLSSPVSGQAISGVWTPTGSGNDYDFFAWEESEVEFPWLNQKDGSNSALFSPGFIPGKGYLVAYEQSSTKAFAGTLNSGAINFELKSTGVTKNWVWTPGWNMLGNPYPSAIDWNLATRTQFEDNFAYIYNTAKSGGAGYEEIDGGSPGAIIPANQGFFVQASSAANGQNFTFNDNLRVHGGTFYKSDVEDVLQLRLAKGDFYDNTTLRIKAEGSLNRDRMDALKMFSFNAAIPQVYTHTTDDVWVAVNSVPEINETLTIPLSIKVPANGNMTLSIAELNGVFADQKIFLVDLLTSVTHNLSQQPEYSFTANTSDSPDRFLLKFEAVGIPEVPGSESLQAWVNGNMLYVINTGATKARVEVYNMHGQLVVVKETAKGLQSLPVNVPPGTYLVKMTSEGATAIRKISIQ